ncbi:unnamed protein product [Spirodela intermedia]|uniref:Aminotransferase-like plant mobile domain-containing protein n=1 Tax=Spirodela intermedia TaxID=51605 RepID=A0A7I8K649_SPIIN|nr:unnamed protein product [Spirodela intermedia]
MSRGGTLVEEEEEVEMLVTLSGDGAIVRRSGRFLRPRATSLYEAAAVPFVPLLREILSQELLLEWPPKVLFRGWRLPQAKWGQWVEKLKPIYRNLWKKARIYDAIMASVCGIRRDSAAIFALLECWCPETSTFVLPWGEVTLTLEDVTVLGGFPVQGEPVRVGALSRDEEEILGKMVEEHKGFRRRSAKKAFHYDWMNFYMAGATGGAAGDQAEHLAFLSLWLSRYVFPSRPYDTVARRVFPIAVRLAQGRKVALAPAVLAAIYRDLRELKQHAVSGAATGPAVSWAPLQVLQLWVWERFISLRPEQRPHFLHWDEPRAARWHCLDQKSKLTLVRSVLESPDEFQWRPYTTNLDDWGHPSFYKDGGEWAVVGSGPAMDDGDGISLFARFLRPCELVGLDCIEPYSPQRVAMQFGLDQDLPGRLPRTDTTWELAWKTYDGGAMEELEVYAPPRLLESDVTRRFYDWQRHCAVARSEAWRSALFQQKRLWQMKQEELFDVNR